MDDEILPTIQDVDFLQKIVKAQMADMMDELQSYVHDVNKIMKQYAHRIMKPHFREQIIGRGDRVLKILARFV